MGLRSLRIDPLSSAHKTLRMVRQAERSASTIRSVLAAARALFDVRGFDSVSIDDIASAAGVAKGAVYHHFSSKRDVFEQVLESVQASLAAELSASSRRINGHDVAASMAASVLAYLDAASKPGCRRILLIDGPIVVGWQRWREIDDRYFAAGVRSGVARLLGPEVMPADIEPVTRLIMGAVMEAALACGQADDAHATARRFAAGLEKLLQGLQPS